MQSIELIGLGNRVRELEVLRKASLYLSPRVDWPLQFCRIWAALGLFAHARIAVDVGRVLGISITEPFLLATRSVFVACRLGSTGLGTLAMK